MATPTPPGGGPQPAPAFLPPPAEITSAVRWPPKRRKLGAWQLATLVIGVPVIAFFAAVGAYTSTKFVFRDPPAHMQAAMSRTPHSLRPSAPAYDLAGYRSAVGGPEEQAFASAISRLRYDLTHPDFMAAAGDAPRLIAAASAWLSILDQTNPPPAYRPGKLAYMQAATVGLRAGETTEQGLRSANLAQLQKGANQAARGKRLLSLALANATPAPTPAATPATTAMGS
jgi:hypothetical protein